MPLNGKISLPQTASAEESSSQFKANIRNVESLASERLNALEESMWLQRAQDTVAGGYLSTDASYDFIKKRLACATSK